jgi:hypothetical protein
MKKIFILTAVRTSNPTKIFWVFASYIRTVSNFSPEDGDSMFLRNAGIYRRVYTAPNPRRTSSSSPP